MSDDAVKPCPFCGGTDIRMDESFGTDSWSFGRWCHACGSIGPISESAEQALAAWNRRADDWRPLPTPPEPGHD